MKPLILSFFAVILGYSLFVDKDKESKLPARPYADTSRLDISGTTQKGDSIAFFANKTVKIY